MACSALTNLPPWESDVEWKKYLADDLLFAEFMKSREAVKFLDAEEAEYPALLTELGVAK